MWNCLCQLFFYLLSAVVVAALSVRTYKHPHIISMLLITHFSDRGYGALQDKALSQHQKAQG